MKFGIWLWGAGCLVTMLASATGWLVHAPPVLATVPAAVYALGAAGLCFGRPDFATSERMLACFLAAAMAICAGTNLPLRAVYAASRKPLEAAALEARASSYGPGILKRASGTWVGGFYVESTQVTEDGSVYLWLTRYRQCRSGFVKSTGMTIPEALIEIDLDQGWRFVCVRD